MNINRQALIAVAAELNEKGIAEIKSANKRSMEELIKKILAATDNGNDLGGLSKNSSATIRAVLNSIGPDVDAGAGDDSSQGGTDDGAGESDRGEGMPETGVEANEEYPADLTSRAAMNVAAADMNELLNLDPAIDLTVEDRIFMRAFKRGTEIAEGNDNFSDYTWRVFEALGMGPERVRMVPAKAEEPATEKKVDKGADASAEDKKHVEKVGKGVGKGTNAEKVIKTDAESAKDKDMPKKYSRSKGPKGPRERKDGVANTIGRFIRDAGKSGQAFKKTDLIDALCKKFPAKSADPLSKTVNMMFCVAPCFGWEIKADGDKYTAEYNG